MLVVCCTRLQNFVTQEERKQSPFNSDFQNCTAILTWLYKQGCHTIPEGENSDIKRKRCSSEILRRTPKRYQDRVLWAWLEIFSPIMHTCQLSRIIWKSPGYGTNLLVSCMGHQISRIKNDFEPFKDFAPLRLKSYPQIDTISGFSTCFTVS